MRIKYILLGALSFAVIFSTAPQTANAGSYVSVGFSSGGHGHRDRYDRGHHRHRGWHPARQYRHHSYYYPSVSYAQYTYPTQVIYQPPVQWISPGYYAASYQGRFCREYQKTVVIGNHQQPAYGTACLQPDGSWEMVQ